jgi:hypothetical protein
MASSLLSLLQFTKMFEIFDISVMAIRRPRNPNPRPGAKKEAINLV